MAYSKVGIGFSIGKSSSRLMQYMLSWSTLMMISITKVYLVRVSQLCRSSVQSIHSRNSFCMVMTDSSERVEGINTEISVLYSTTNKTLSRAFSLCCCFGLRDKHKRIIHTYAFLLPIFDIDEYAMMIFLPLGTIPKLNNGVGFLIQISTSHTFMYTCASKGESRLKVSIVA